MAKKSGRDAFLAKHKSKLIDLEDISHDNLMYRTGSIKADALLRGGLRRGKISMLWGPQQSGKTVIALATARNLLEQDMPVLWFDYEHSMDVEDPSDMNWLKVNGIDPDTMPIDIVPPIYADDMLEMIETAIVEKSHALAVVDSIAGVGTRRELDGDYGDSSYGSLAAILSSGLKKINAAYGTSKNRDLHLMFLNQVRDNLKSRFGGSKPYGGNALPHYAHYIIRVWKAGAEDTPEEALTESRFQIDKSKFAPRNTTKVFISSKYGLDVASEIMEYALWEGLLIQKGAWYTPVDPDTGAVLTDSKVQGKSAARQFVIDAGWANSLYDQAVEAAKSGAWDF